MRAAKLRAITNLTSYAIAANFINSVAYDFVFMRGPHHGFLEIWTLALFAMLAAAAVPWRMARRRDATDPVSQNAIVGASFLAFAIGLLWVIPVLVMFGDATPEQRIVLVATAGGMVAGGAMTLATVWQASLNQAITVAAPTIAILLAPREPMLWGLAALAGSLSFLTARTVIERAHLSEDALVAQLRLREQSEVISFLLKEYEEKASDWLFEVGKDLRLMRVSDRCANLYGRPAAELESAEFLSFVEPPGNEGALQKLRRAFTDRAPFRDVLLRMSTGGEERWWSVSGHPMTDATNAFRGFRGVGSDVTGVKSAEASVDRLANYDSVTGLPNRHYMDQRLAEAVEVARATGVGFALISLDLDRFKQVNDTLGHQTGDHLLREVAARIRSALDESDAVARFGGDEFVILQSGLPQSAEAAAAGLAQKLVSRIGAPYEIDGQRVLVGASIGIAIAPRDGDSASELLRNSDLALYRAKADGKGRFSFFAPEMDAEMQSRRHLEIDLRDALEHGGLTVHFQPLLDAASGQVTACEALVRWLHPTLGQVSPAKLIPIAEETGLIVPLGDFVLRTACKEAATWPRNIIVGVNLSAAQFRGGELASRIKDILGETGLPPQRLDLEITETMLVDDREMVLATLKKLRELGVSISLDDFGTGYSSLAYLSSFPFDKIKIDRTFVRDVSRRPDSAAIIRAITSLASTLGMLTTAEGVENVDELDWLLAHGCGEMQGYLFSAAVPANEFRSLIGARPETSGPSMEAVAA